MLFVEPTFFIFFALVFLAYWSLPANGQRKTLLLIASYAFYAAWDWRFLGLIALSTLIDFVAGARIAASQGRRRRAWLTASVFSNLGILAVFKYMDFFAGSAAALLQTFGASVNATTLELTLPVGISFFTFQSMSYTIDIYRGTLEPRRSLRDFALFVAFFPQLVAGPIVRARDYLPQLDAARAFASVPLRACLTLFLIGFFKKVCVSDNLALIIDPLFADPGAFRASAIGVGALLYAAQIYCDFSGYSDMAIAAAGLLGYRLPRNFAAPYFSRSPAEFWRRWHISLSTWLRDYLYISLGGNRRGRWLTLRNLMLTMLLGGLWHGAAWNFVVWGALHGLLLIVQREWPEWPARRKRFTSDASSASDGAATTHSLRRALVHGVSVLNTVWWVCLAWLFFRIESLPDAWTAAYAYVTWQSPGSQTLAGAPWLIAALLVAMHALAWRSRPECAVQRLPALGFAPLYGACWAVALLLAPVEVRPFIYFQF